MPKISKKPVYPQDTNVTMGDYLIGTNVNTSNLRTQTYSVESLINLANEVVGNSTSSYKFSINPLVTHLEQGFFTSENDKENPLEVTKLSFNRLTVQGVNASSAFIFLVQSGFFTIKLKNVSDLNNIIYLAPSNLVQGTNFVTFNVANFASNGLLVDGDTYFLDYALKTAESTNQDNKIKPVYVFMPEAINIGDSEATYINSLINFEVKDFEIPLFIITQDAIVSGSTFFTAFPAIRKYFLKEKGKGFYGQEGTQLTMSDLELVYEKFANVVDIINLPTTQFINIGDIGVSEIQDVVNLDSGYLIQEQSVGYRIFATIVNSTSVNYLFLAPGGTYGINLLQTVAADFQIFGGENSIVQINDTTPSLTEVYSSQKVEDSFVPLSGTFVGRPITGKLQLALDSLYNGFTNGSDTQERMIGLSDEGLPFMLYKSEDYSNLLTLQANGLFLSAEGLFNLGFIGFSSGQDFTANYPTGGSEDLIFPQIKYIKDKFQRLPRLVNANTTALNNEILHVTADATITDVVGAVAGNVYKVIVILGLATVGGQIYGKGETIERYFDGTNYITTLPNGQKYIDVTANATVTNDWYLAIVRIKATSTITIPAGLNRRIAFTCFAYPTITATFVAGAGETVTSAKGLVLKNGTTNSVFSDGLNNVIIIGEMTVS